MKAEATLTDAQVASLLASANRITLRTIAKCEAFDGKSFRVGVQHGDGTWSSFTDGISFG